MVKDINPEISDTDAHMIAYQKLYFETIEPLVVEDECAA